MTEWTEADKGAYVRFAQEVRDLRDDVSESVERRMQIPGPTVLHRLQVSLDRLAAR